MARRQVEELQAALAEAEGREAAMAAELAELRQQAENAEVAASEIFSGRIMPFWQNKIIPTGCLAE